MTHRVNGNVARTPRLMSPSTQGMMPEEGALPEQADKVMVDFGYPIGPFATADLGGLDIGYDSRQRRAQRRSRAIGPEDRWRLVPLREGRPHPDPELARMIKEKAA